MTAYQRFLSTGKWIWEHGDEFASHFEEKYEIKKSRYVRMFFMIRSY